MKAVQRLYRTVDDEVVVEGDVRAAFLLAAEGDEVPPAYVDKLPNGDDVDEKPLARPGNKASAPPVNKAASRPRNKAAESDG